MRPDPLGTKAAALVMGTERQRKLHDIFSKRDVARSDSTYVGSSMPKIDPKKVGGFPRVAKKKNQLKSSFDHFGTNTYSLLLKSKSSLFYAWKSLTFFPPLATLVT